MSINTFGLSTGDIAGMVQNLTINASSSPNITAVTDMILLAASEVEREASVVGIDTQSYTDPLESTYQILRRMVSYKVLAELLVARERGNPAAGDYYIKRYDDLRGHLRVRPSVVAQTGEGPDRLSYITQTNSTELDIEFYQSPAGAIVLNGL